MGYYTRHNLEIISGNDYNTNYKLEISKTTGYTNCFEEDIKWYDHEKDMRAYSKKHPQVLFKLSGEGEEYPDMWIEYYKNGKMQRCKGEVIYPDFDENKLI